MRKISFAFIVCVGLISYAEDVMRISPSAPDGMIDGHEYVDLGLPSGTLWANSNICSDTPYGPGACFSWGEVEPRESFRYDNYKFFEDVEIFENGKYNYVLTDIGCDICGTEYDAAHVQWGDAWRMPEAEEFKELLACCQADFGHYLNLQYCGLSLCGPNGNSIFLPINVYDNNDCSFAILTGNYWSGSLAEDNPNVNGALAVSLYFSNSTPKSLHNLRYMGQSIRPVVNRKIVGAAVDSYTETAMEISYADGMLFVNGLCDSCEAAVVDVSGRLIAKSQLLGGRCELPDLRGGIYVVSVLKSGSVIATRKIVVK